MQSNVHNGEKMGGCVDPIQGDPFYSTENRNFGRITIKQDNLSEFVAGEDAK